MGWKFLWVSSFNNDFNYDFNVSFRPEDVAAGRARYNYRAAPEWTARIQDLSGRSVFYKNEADKIFHTYSAYSRGSVLDAMPKGRNETGPYHSLTDWARPRNMCMARAGPSRAMVVITRRAVAAPRMAGERAGIAVATVIAEG